MITLLCSRNIHIYITLITILTGISDMGIALPSFNANTNSLTPQNQSSTSSSSSAVNNNNNPNNNPDNLISSSSDDDDDDNHGSGSENERESVLKTEEKNSGDLGYDSLGRPIIFGLSWDNVLPLKK